MPRPITAAALWLCSSVGRAAIRGESKDIWEPCPMVSGNVAGSSPATTANDNGCDNIASY